MRATESTIWMNVTTSTNWQRPSVGIVRVERSLCAELGKLYGERFRQCVWQGEKFVEWLPVTQKQAITSPRNHEGTPTRQAKEPLLPPIFPILSKKQALVALGQSLLSLMPRKLRPHFNQLLYALRPRVVRLIAKGWLTRRVNGRHGESAPAISMTPAPVPIEPNAGELFSQGDILISIGLDWDYPYFRQFYTLRKQKGVKVVTCCYDLIPVLYPQYCVNDVAGVFTSYFLEVADGSDLVLCISQQSEKDLTEMLDRTGGARPPTHVFRLGDNVPKAANEEISSAVKAICQEAFILYVSTIDRRKNHEVLYRAYHLLCGAGKRTGLPKLVFVGMQGWGVSELMKDIELDPLTQGMIVCLNHVSDAELQVLYESTKFCVSPSFYEGWGLPVGEALSLGKAVLASGQGSLPEVGGELVRYVDPWNPRAWADEIYRMALDDVWRAEWESKAKENYQLRTWYEAAVSVKQKIDGIVG